MHIDTVSTGTSASFVAPALAAEAVDAAQGWLSTDDQPVDLRSEFPHAFHPEGGATLGLLRHRTNLVSVLVAREVTLVTEAGPAAYTLIGSVVTDPAARRRGFASQLVRQAVERAKAREQDAVSLWTSDWRFYERLGFQGAGRQREVELGPPRGSLAPGLRPAEARDLPALWGLHQQKPLRVDRSLTDMALQLSIQRMRVYVLDRRGEPAAYVCLGKGLDFDGWWHDFGGTDEDVATLIHGAMDVLDLEQATVLLPPYRHALHEILRRLETGVREGVCALRLPLTPLGEAAFFIDGLDSV